MKRVDIRGQIFGKLLVLRFIGNKNSHALWKCKCLNCHKATFVTYSNLISGNTKSCFSCGQRKLSRDEDDEVSNLYKNGYSMQKIAEKFSVSRSTVITSLLRTNTKIGAVGKPTK
jgi:ATP/maltotriose-dependent transcriptional regulator MalT